MTPGYLVEFPPPTTKVAFKTLCRLLAEMELTLNWAVVVVAGGELDVSLNAAMGIVSEMVPDRETTVPCVLAVKTVVPADPVQLKVRTVPSHSGKMRVHLARSEELVAVCTTNTPPSAAGNAFSQLLCGNAAIFVCRLEAVSDPMN